MPQLELADAIFTFQKFLDQGGPVLLVIMAVTFLQWLLVFERFYYLATAHKAKVRQVRSDWAARRDHKSWYAHQIRDQLIGEVRSGAEANLIAVRTLVALLPMLGLLGTVTGMVVVFDVMAVTGSSNARAMAGGISQATIPTMAGMTTAIAGIYVASMLTRRVRREVQATADSLELR